MDESEWEDAPKDPQVYIQASHNEYTERIN